MTGEYRIAKGWRIFIYIFGPLMIALFVSLIVMPFMQDKFDLALMLFSLLMSVSMIALFTYGLVDTIKGKFIITTDSLIVINPLGTKVLKFDEVKGYRTDNNYIHIIPVNKDKKKIKVSTYTEKSHQINLWLSTMFPELDAKEMLESESKILESDELGITRQIREDRLTEARRIARIANATGFVLFFWITFYPRPYAISLSVGMVYPIGLLAILSLYRGLIRMDEKKNSAYPSVLTGFIMAGLGLMLRALLDFNVLEYQQLWITVSIVSIMLIAGIIFITGGLTLKKFRDYLSISGMCISIFLYTFGSYTLANCIYDRSTPMSFECEIVDKEVSSGKTTMYYLDVRLWAERTTIEKVKVSAEEYNATSIGDYVTVYQMEGFFKTPWYFVRIE